jgi:hypothetical protein
MSTLVVAGGGFAAGAVVMSASLLAGSPNAFEDRATLQGEVSVNGVVAADVPTTTGSPSASPTSTTPNPSPTRTPSHTAGRTTTSAARRVYSAPTATRTYHRYTPPPPPPTVTSAGS